MCNIFICHASEDKQDIARPLAEQLRLVGYQVWYDEFALKLGDSLRRSIDHGLANADFGIVILSPAFFAKSWTSLELGALTAGQTEGKKIILPVWHKVGLTDVERFSPMLADKLSVSTDDGLAAVVSAIQQTVLGISPVPKKSKKFRAISWRSVIVAILLLTFGFGAFQLYSITLGRQLARAKLDARPLEYTPYVFTQKAAEGDLEAVKLFLKAGMNPDVREPLRYDEPSGRTALVLAADKGHAVIVEALLDSNANVNERDEYFHRSALSWAASAEHRDVVQLLLKAGADDKAKQEAVGSAVTNGNMEILHLLLANGAKLDQAMAQELFSGAVSYSNNLEMVKYLLSFGIEINAKDKNGNTALFEAARNEKFDAGMNENSLLAIELLLSRGADVNVRNNDGETPIMRTNSIAVVRALVAKGADINAKDNNGNSVLGWFLHSGVLATYELEPIMRILIAHGADVNGIVNNPPISLLMDLLGQQNYNDLSQFNLLIDNGANVNFKDEQGITPLMCVLMGFSDRWGEEDDEWLISTVRRLLENGATVQDRAADGSTALKLAEKLPKGTKARVIKLLKARYQS